MEKDSRSGPNIASQPTKSLVLDDKVVILYPMFGASSDDVWYLIALGSLAIMMAIWARRGPWWVLTRRVPLHLLPLGYVLGSESGATERHRVARIGLGPVLVPLAQPAGGPAR